MAFLGAIFSSRSLFFLTLLIFIFNAHFALGAEWVPNSTGQLEHISDPGVAARAASQASANRGAVNTSANAAKGANEACLATGVVYGTTPCWDWVGFIPVRGICLDRGVCKATAVGNITGGFLQVGAQMFVGKFWGGVGNSIFGQNPSVIQPTQPQCPQRYRVSVPSSDPCAVYVPPTATSSLNTSDALLRALGKPSSQTTPTKSQPSVGNILLNRVENVVAPTGRAPATAEIFPIEPGSRGDIQLTTTGSTIVAELVDAKRNLQFSAFFGAKTLTEAPRTLPERMCIVRPWTHPQVFARIPVSVFDSICSQKGYKTGLPAAALAAASTQKTTSTNTAPTTAPADIATSSPPTPTVKPAAAIWAVPESVPLGSRTTVFWNSQGVISCTETSPDGNFTGNTKSGRESTVAITGPTTFIISCLTPDGLHVTDFVRVNLAI